MLLFHPLAKDAEILKSQIPLYTMVSSLAQLLEAAAAVGKKRLSLHASEMKTMPLTICSFMNERF